jgi:hypothetical protein
MTNTCRYHFHVVMWNPCNVLILDFRPSIPLLNLRAEVANTSPTPTSIRRIVDERPRPIVTSLISPPLWIDLTPKYARSGWPGVRWFMQPRPRSSVLPNRAYPVFARPVIKNDANVYWCMPSGPRSPERGPFDTAMMQITWSRAETLEEPNLRFA